MYSLWDGEADSTPPSYAGKSFAPGHNHYATTSGAFEAVDLDYLIRNVTEHGYGGADFGSQIVILAHPDDADIITTFRAGQVAADGGKAANDFILRPMPPLRSSAMRRSSVIALPHRMRASRSSVRTARRTS